jgi:hypothetical protein
LAALALALLVAGGAVAEERTVEALGIYGFTPPKNLTAQRQQAVLEGVRAAVARVVAESLPALDAEAATGVFRRLFLRDARDYVVRFRVVEDRGVQPRQFTTNRNATHEYQVRVEASVDARQVRQRLVTAGLLAGGEGALRRVDLTLEELPSYAALERIRLALVDQLQAESAVPVEFTRRRAVLAVRTRSDARGLLERLAAADLDGLRVEPREAGSDRAVAAVRAP